MPEAGQKKENSALQKNLVFWNFGFFKQQKLLRITQIVF